MISSRTVAARAPVVDPYDRELVISCGAALGMLEVAATHFGFLSRIGLFADPGDPDLLARVDLSEKSEKTDTTPALFEAIEARCTTRTPFEDALPPDAVMAKCQATAKASGVAFDVLTAADDRRAVAALVAQGNCVQFDDPAFAGNLRPGSIRPDWGAATACRASHSVFRMCSRPS